MMLQCIAYRGPRGLFIHISLVLFLIAAFPAVFWVIRLLLYLSGIRNDQIETVLWILVILSVLSPIIALAEIGFLILILLSKSIHRRVRIEASLFAGIGLILIVSWYLYCLNLKFS